MEPSYQAIWIRRPAACRESGCNEPVAWAVLHGPPGTAPRVAGTCAAHADDRWETKPFSHDADGMVTAVVRIGEPGPCGFCSDDDPPSNHGDCLVLRFDENGDLVVVLQFCESCVQAAKIEIPNDTGLCYTPSSKVPPDRLFGPPPWWQRYVVDPELGNVLGLDYVDLMRRVTSTWEDLFWVALRGAGLGVPAALLMAFVPRGAWWLLLGIAPVVVGYLIGRIVGFYRLEGGVFSDPGSDTRFEDGQVVSDVPETERGAAMQLRLDPISAGAAALVLFVSPGVISATILLLCAAPFGVSYGHTVADLGLFSVLAFLLAGLLVSGVVSFAVRFAWNLLILLPLLFAYWFLGRGD